MILVLAVAVATSIGCVLGIMLPVWKVKKNQILYNWLLCLFSFLFTSLRVDSTAFIVLNPHKYSTFAKYTVNILGSERVSSQYFH
jgi:hypothetical protein